MALVNADTVNAQMRGFGKLGALRQVGLMIGLAASVALGVAIALWSHEPNYGLLYANLNDRDKAEVMDALSKVGIAYRIDRETGAVTVPAAQVPDARLKLATLGLPKGTGMGYELLDKPQGLGTSRLLQMARHTRALEGELARSVTSLRAVESARVHLAIPKQTVFVRDRSKPTASVVVNLYPGRGMDDSQVAGIVHLVASSVPDLETERVTVVDQKGQLLTARRNADPFSGDEHFKQSRRLEETYVRRIQDILSPIIGAEGVRAQVNAELDFTRVESSSEQFNPDKPVVRSEQLANDANTDAAPGGVPGALVNQPPPAGVVDGDPGNGGGGRESTSNRVTRNYEIDRTISHTRRVPGAIQRLSVAVVVDYRKQVDEQGQVQMVPLGEDELNRINTLVREAIGFSEARGDSVDVINAPFTRAAESEPVPELPVWQQPWVWDLAKQVIGGLGVLFVLLFVLRPALRSLADKGREPQMTEVGLDAEQAAALGLPPGAQLGLEGPDQDDAVGGANDYSERLDQAKSLVMEDPKRVAQVVKAWVAADGQ